MIDWLFPHRKYEERGKVAVIWSGTDYSGCRFYGDVRYVTVRKLRAHLRQHKQRGFQAQLERPSVARTIPFVRELENATYASFV